VRVLTQPDHGTLTVNPDNSLALVMSASSFSGQMEISYEVTNGDGSVELVTSQVAVSPSPIENGWGQGDFYMLESDQDGSVVVEWGDNHRDVYVSGSDEALSLQEIADIEGIPVDRIDYNWLMDRPEYGSSEATALDPQAGNLLWYGLMLESETQPASHWLRMEAGYEYNMPNLLHSGMNGESQLHPLHVTSYGDGPKPEVTSNVVVFAEGATNVVISDIELSGGMNYNGSQNILMDDVVVTGNHEFVVENVDSFTLRNSEVYDIARAESLTSGIWEENPNRISGIYIAGTEGVLIENSLFDRNGWAEGYDINMSTDDPQPPSRFNHNIYIQTTVEDLTFRDSITMRGASFGAQFRSGAFVEDNVFLENNAAVYVHGGINGGRFEGNYSLYANNVITGGANLPYGDLDGFLGFGIGDYAPLTTTVGNIVTHLANPDDPAEQAARTVAEPAFQTDGQQIHYNDTIVYNWAPQGRTPQNENIDGLDTNVLDRTTIQRFAAELLGDPNATIADLADYLRAAGAAAPDGESDADLIVDFFRTGFGLEVGDRLGAETLRFVPDALGDGIRWDNRMNWSTDDLPGEVAGDSVDLAGNHVYYGGTTEIRNLDFGNSGELIVRHGRLDIEGQIDSDGEGGRFLVQDAGQVWVDGYSDGTELTVDVEGGRFANTGAFEGHVDMNVSGGQAILATEGGRFDLSSDSELTITGDQADVGFDGTGGGAAVLRLEEGSTLRFEATNGAIGGIDEFRSGANGDADSDVASGVNLGEATLELDITQLGGSAGIFSLISVDEMVGAFSDINFQGLSDNRDATLVFDYGADEVRLLLGAEGRGSGSVSIRTEGDQMDAQDGSALWTALTENQPVLPDDVNPDTVRVNDEEIDDFL